MNTAPGQLGVARGVEGCIRIEDIDQVVANRLSLSGAGFRRADVQEAIDLAGVAPDDLGAEGAGEAKAEVGLADGGRANNDRDGTDHRALLGHPSERLLKGLEGVWCEEYKKHAFERRLWGTE
jgi:hypothetical protein